MNPKRSRITRWLVRGIVGTVLLAVVGGVICVYLAISSSVHAEKTLHAINFVTVVVDRFVQQEHRWPKSWDELPAVEATGVGSMYSWPADADAVRQFVTIDFDADLGVLAAQTIDDFDAIKPIGSYYPYKDYGHVQSLIETVKHAVSNQRDAGESQTVDDNPKGVYVECEPGDAETTLLFQLAVADVFTSEKSEFPLRTVKSPLELPFRRLMVFNANGVTPNGHGISYSVYLSVDDGTESNITVSISCYWTASDLSQEKFDRKVVIPIGVTTERQLSDNVSIKAHFQTPSQQEQGQNN